MPRGEREPLIGYGGLDDDGGNKKAKCIKCIPWCIVVFVIVFVISTVLAIPLSVLLSYNEVDKVFKYIVTNQVQLTKGSATTKQFTQPGAPIFMKFYMFSLTNMEAFVTNGTTPHFEEIGPFVYRENKTKYDLVWNEDETIMRYNQTTSYTFDYSSHPNTTNITTINLPLLGMLLQLEKIRDSPILQKLPELIRNIIEDELTTLDEILRKEFKENLFMTRPVKEVIWGYRDEILGFLADSPLSQLIPAIPKDGVFQLEEISSTTGPNMIYTGKGDSKKTARFLMWNGKTAIDGWGTPYSRMINGTEALLFHPGVSTDEKLELFVSELFRSGYFTYYQKVNEYGIDMYQFRLPKEELNGSSQDPGFFMKELLPGMLNLSPVYPLNAPVYVSKPHFLDCNEEYLKNVSGLTPNRDLHDAFLNVEPITGAVLHAAKRLQVNVRLNKYKGLPELAGIPDVTFIPIMWVDEGGKLNSTSASEFKKKIYNPESELEYGTISVTAVIGAIALVSLCVFIVLIAILCEVKIKRRRNRNRNIQY